jgi:hypothetical protein
MDRFDGCSTSNNLKAKWPVGWSICLHFIIIHRPGRKHGNADALSKIPLVEDHPEEDTFDIFSYISHIFRKPITE